MTNESDKVSRGPGRPKLTEQEKPAMRDTVLRIASKLFMELGYEPVSMKQVADEAGVTKASVYYYFSSKAELFTVSVTEMMVRIQGSTREILKQPGDLKSRLRLIASAKLRHSHIDFESMMREAIPSLTDEQRGRIRMAEQGIHETMTESFAAAMKEGEIARCHPLLLSHAFASLLMMGNRASDFTSADDSPKPLSDQIVDIFWNGVGHRGEARKEAQE